MTSEISWPSRARKGLQVWRLNRVLAIINTRVMELKDGPNRELPLVWNIMHMYSTLQIAKLLALKRGLDPELVALTCAFHDCYTLFTGRRKDHGIKANDIINELVANYNHSRGDLEPITDQEKKQMITAIAAHSDKNTISNDPLTELLKDVDSIDSYLHGLTQGRKTGRIPRGNAVLKELSINHEIIE